jgi:hypothetical protein
MQMICQALLQAAFQPDTAEKLGVYYLLWITVFLTINIAWDFISVETPAFHLHRFREKVGTAYAGSTFCRSLLLLLSLFSADTAKIVGDTMVPIILASFAGVLHSISDLCPYSPRQEN